MGGAAPVRRAMRQAMATANWGAAAELANRWLAQGERDWQIALNLAICLSHLNPNATAVWLDLASDALTESGGDPTARLGLADLAIEAGQWERGLALLEAGNGVFGAAQLWPRLQLQARALARLDRSAEACLALDRLAPAQRDWRWALALADVKVQACDWAAAETLLRQVLERHPRLAIAHQNLAIVLLSQRRCQEAWPHYEWRRSNPRLDPQGCPRPLPPLEQLQGRDLLLVGEQGIGDQIMVSRYLPALAELAGSLKIEPAERLVPLLRRLLPAGVVVNPPSGSPVAVHQGNPVVIGMASLPLLFWGRWGVAATAAANGGYLQADAARMERWRRQLAALGPGWKLGLSWLGGTHGAEQRQRSLTPADRQRLLAQPGVHWIDLQYLGSSDDPAASQPQHPQLHRFGAVGHDLEDTLALIACLDGVVSTRQTAAHLAGSLGLTGEVLVPARPEWRYWGDQDRWAWYPSLQLLHQQQRGSWDSELDAVERRWAQPPPQAANAARS